MEAADRASLAQETLMKDESLAVRVATEVARALNLTVCVPSMYMAYLLLISIFIFLSLLFMKHCTTFALTSLSHNTSNNRAII